MPRFLISLGLKSRLSENISQLFIFLMLWPGLSACTLLNWEAHPRIYDPDPELIQYYREKKMEEKNRARVQLGRSPTANSDPEIETRMVLNRLERQIPTQNEKVLYYKYKPYFPNDKARIYFLLTPGFEAKSDWIRRHKITTDVFEHPPEIQNLINNNDICLGMTQQAVQEAWGEPELKEVAGNPIYGNERWKYIISLPTENGFHQEIRYVYFEGGLVSGWEKF